MKSNLERRWYYFPAMLVAAMLAPLIVPVSASSAVTPSIIASLTGPLPTFAAGSGTALVIGIPDLSGMSTGSSVQMVPLASEPVSGASFSISISMSPIVQSWLSGLTSPVANVMVIIQSATSMSAETVVIPLGSATSAPTSTTSPTSSGSTQVPVVTTSAFPSPWAYSPASSGAPSTSALRHAQALAGLPRPTGSVSPNYNYGGCPAYLLSDAEESTQIGELHTANVTGMTARYYYENYADSTITTGFSSSNSNFQAGGTVSVTNSIGTNASTAEAAGQHNFIGSHLMYGDFLVSSAYCGSFYAVMSYDAIGDVYQNSQAPENPWGSCAADPYSGVATVSANGGTYGTHSQTAEEYSAIASAFGFTFGGSTGYSSSIDIEWHNNGTVATYVCGNNNVANLASILYNNPS